MTHTVFSTYAEHQALAHVEEITNEQPWRWLAAGWRDLKRTPATSIGYGTLFAVVSYLATLGTLWYGVFYLIPALLGGFFLVAPALGLGLYEISRRLERGQPADFRQYESKIRTLYLQPAGQTQRKRRVRTDRSGVHQHHPRLGTSEPQERF